MPTSARKSSLGGGRNRTQKAHIPYRGDNPEVGKKTGIAIQHVERKSDGFEPFADVLRQADGRTPPRPKIRKKTPARAERYADEYDEDDGEMSMQIDSPVQQLVSMRPPTTPPTAGGRRSSIRPVARTSDVDYDKIPSPRPLQRASRNAAPGPSSLSRSVHARDIEPEPSSDSPNEDAGDYYDANTQNMDDAGFDDYAQENTPTQASVANHSFGQIDEEDEEEEQTPEPEPPKPTKKKPLPPPREPSQSEEEIEAEIAQGLEDVGLGGDTGGEEEEEEEEEATPPPKKTKIAPEKKVTHKIESRSKKENRPQREGVRRSKREHYAPLEYWRGEKLVYGRSNNSGPILVPQIKEIVRIPKEHTEPLRSKRKRGTSMRERSRSRAAGAEEDQIPPALPVVNPEEGWDDETSAVCTVIHFTSKEEVERRIAWTAKMVKPKMASDHSWSFDKIFGDDEFIAAGQLIIPPRGRKPSKAAKDNTYVFYVVEGAVNFKIHETNMILATGGMFMVPRGNTYLIENISNRAAKLFFTQARKVEMNAAERAAKAEHNAEMQRRKSIVRSSSAGAPAGARADAPLSGARSKSAAVASTSRKV